MLLLLLSVLLLVGIPSAFWLGFWLGWQVGGQTEVWLALRRFIDTAFPGDFAPMRSLVPSEDDVPTRGHQFASGFEAPPAAAGIAQRNPFASTTPPAATGLAQRNSFAFGAPPTAEAAFSEADSLEYIEESFAAPHAETSTSVEPLKVIGNAAGPRQRQVAPSSTSTTSSSPQVASYSQMAAPIKGKPKFMNFTKALSPAQAAEAQSAKETREALTAARDEIFRDPEGKPYTWELLRTPKAKCKKCNRQGHTTEQCGKKVKFYLQHLGPVHPVSSPTPTSSTPSPQGGPEVQPAKPKGGASVESPELYDHICDMHPGYLPKVEVTRRLLSEAIEALEKSGPEGSAQYEQKMIEVNTRKARLATVLQEHGDNCAWQQPVVKPSAGSVEEPATKQASPEPAKQPATTEPSNDLAVPPATEQASPEPGNAPAVPPANEPAIDNPASKNSFAVLPEVSLDWAAEVEDLPTEGEPVDIENALRLINSWVQDSPGCDSTSLPRQMWINRLEKLYNDIRDFIEASVMDSSTSGSTEVEKSHTAFRTWRMRADYRVGPFLNALNALVRDTERELKKLELPVTVEVNGKGVPSKPAGAKQATKRMKALRTNMFDLNESHWPGYMSTIEELDSKLQAINGASFVGTAATIKKLLIAAHPTMPAEARAHEVKGWLPRVTLPSLPSLPARATLTES